MSDYEILKSIEHLQPNNLFLSYIIERIQDNNYRGIQCSQHNRLTYEYFKSLLYTIYDKSQGSSFTIHIGDDNGILQPQAATYYAIVNEIRQKVGKGTINSVKKNTFPDLARAGLLNRYNSKGEKITESLSKGEDKIFQKRSSVHEVALSSLGLQFVKAQTEFERRKYFTDLVDKLTKNAATELVEILSTDDRFDDINILEFMYILSDDRVDIHYNDKLLYLTEYRKLGDIQKERLDKYLQLYCDPARKIGYKLNARDYHNWKNESQQIFGLLSNSTYFKVINDKLILNNGEYGLFIQQAKRSQRPKDSYFQYHQICKRPNYELHHIVPFKKAITQQDAKYIDDERNLIYLSAQKHAEFTAKQNANIRASYSQPIISFLPVDGIEGIINVNLEKSDALLSNNKIGEIISYNKMLLQKFYHHQSNVHYHLNAQNINLQTDGTINIGEINEK